MRAARRLPRRRGRLWGCRGRPSRRPSARRCRPAGGSGQRCRAAGRLPPGGRYVGSRWRRARPRRSRSLGHRIPPLWRVRNPPYERGRGVPSPSNARQGRRQARARAAGDSRAGGFHLGRAPIPPLAADDWRTVAFVASQSSSSSRYSISASSVGPAGVLSPSRVVALGLSQIVPHTCEKGNLRSRLLARLLPCACTRSVGIARFP